MNVFPLLSIAIWFFCVWFCTTTMGSKGRSAVIGFLLGAILGLVGVVIVALLPPKDIAYGRYLR